MTRIKILVTLVTRNSSHLLVNLSKLILQPNINEHEQLHQTWLEKPLEE